MKLLILKFIGWGWERPRSHLLLPHPSEESKDRYRLRRRKALERSWGLLWEDGREGEDLQCLEIQEAKDAGFILQKTTGFL